MPIHEEKFDVVVIGGGPAGMMAAGAAAGNGARVLLLEKNDQLGKKLLITGNGRCNITHAVFDDNEFIRQLENKKAKFLHSSLAQFGPQNVVSFFENRHLPIKTEDDGRMFPASEKAQDVLEVLVNFLKEKKVNIKSEQKILGFKMNGNTIESIEISSHSGTRKIMATNFILATGGKSYPMTGSTGDGYSLAKTFGHKIVTPQPSLVPIKTKENWTKKLTGLSLKNVRLSVLENGKKIIAKQGDLIFTLFGLSGPVVFDVSRHLQSNQKLKLSIDLFPDLAQEDLDKKLLETFEKNANKDLENCLSFLLPKNLAHAILENLKIDQQLKANATSKIVRQKIVRYLKNVILEMDGFLGFDQAMVTRGGIDTKEIDPKTMKSKIVENLFFAGEIIDIDGPTGGYNLQICWSTGFCAGTHAANN
jgi:predicted Rossmann fold flavoprotein